MPGNEEGGEMAGLKSQTQGQGQERKNTIGKKKLKISGELSTKNVF